MYTSVAECFTCSTLSRGGARTDGYSTSARFTGVLKLQTETTCDCMKHARRYYKSLACLLNAVYASYEWFAAAAPDAPEH